MNNKLIFDQLISFVPQYIFWKDRSGIFLGCNEAFAQQFGFTDEKDIIGKSDYDFDWSPDLRDKYIADDQEVMSTGKPKLNFERVWRLSFQGDLLDCCEHRDLTYLKKLTHSYLTPQRKVFWKKLYTYVLELILEKLSI